MAVHMQTPDPRVERLLAVAPADADSLGALLELYRPLLLLRCRGIQHGSRDIAEDIVQQTFAKAVRAFGSFRGKTQAEFEAWIGRIHRNHLIDVLRRTRPEELGQQSLNDAIGDDAATSVIHWLEPAQQGKTPSNMVIEGETALRLAAIIERLPPDQRDAVRMKYLEGITLAEIAVRLNRSAEAVAGLTRRGLARLRAQMSQSSWLDPRT